MLNLPRLATRVAIAATAGYLSACSAITFGIANVPASFGPFERKADISYGEDKRQKLDVYVPTSEGAKSEGADAAQLASHKPVVIFWYGGSWQSGSKNDY